LIEKLITKIRGPIFKNLALKSISQSNNQPTNQVKIKAP